MRIIPTAEINLQNLKDNFGVIRHISPDTFIMPVVKADAYGHGLMPVVHALSEAGADGFCVAVISELETLINSGITKPILHMGKLYKEILSLSEFGNIWLTVNSEEDIHSIEKYFHKTGRRTTIHLKIDTGMGRLGVSPEDAGAIADILYRHPGIKLDGVWSHLATSEELDSGYFYHQLELFKSISGKIMQSVPGIRYRHLANSAAIFKYPESHFNMIRPGISIYGSLPYQEKNNVLKPVMKLSAPVTQIKEMSKGTSIGYNRKYILKSDGLIAIVQAGYADGVNTGLANIGFVLFRNERLKIIGKISMDQLAVDATGTDLKAGDMVTVWGEDVPGFKVEDVAAGIGKIPYELLTSLSVRVEKKIVGEKN